MSIVVQKYGGTSVGNIERIRKVAERMVKTKAAGHQCVIVVSAMGKQTDELINLASEITHIRIPEKWICYCPQANK